MFRRVLVALDREPASERILSWVRRLLAPPRAEVRLVAVIPIARAVVVDGRALAYVDQREDAECRASDFRLAVLAGRLREDGLAASTETRVGDPVEAVLAATRAWRADAIALAAAAAGGWRWLARDVTDDIVRRSPVPVLVARRSGQRLA
jgi:nucleotide-binding universal stress UspA family protein